jgi:hypothetical protein
MAYTLWSQDIFSKGELSPFMYARCTVNEYLNGLKRAQNVLTYPTGAAGKRFGTYFNSILNAAVTPQNLYFQTFQYLDECVYQLVFYTGNIDIYLEGLKIANLSTSLTQKQVYNVSTTVLGALFRVAGQGFKPYDLERLDLGITPVNIGSFSSPSFKTVSPVYAPLRVYPARFSVTGGTIMQTDPPIAPGITYFVASTNTTDTALLFATSQQAKAYLVDNSATDDAFTITSLGTGTTSISVLNNWQFAHAVFRDVPVYDFNGTTTSYDALTFTPSATTGSGVTITVSGAYAPLTTSYIGGAFIGGGGTSRITAVASTTSFTVSVQKPFDSTNAILGSLALLAEPAWSDVRGWPQVCSSYQNRALFANTASLPNGFYGSVVNDYADFGDLTNDDDDAISWYPTSNNMNFIRFIVPYRSITVHTNTGIYSSPLSDVVAITPTNFTLQLQDSTPADVLEPQAIDNQILVLSGNDAHQMLWDGINNAYTSDVVSIINEQTIRNPVDETAFRDIRRAGSRFVFIINENGSMAAFQTLLSQNVSGFTSQIMEQSYGDASFIQAASSADGRCWFVVEREIADAQAPIAITDFTPTTLKAIASNLSTDTPTAINFTTSGSLPSSNPQIVTGQYYWAIGIDANYFEVYTTQEDALTFNTSDPVAPITFLSAGTSSHVITSPLKTIYTLEELTTDVFLDCTVVYNGTSTATVQTGTLFNAQDVKMIGNGFGFDSPAEDNISNEINFFSHGQAIGVTKAYIGFPINTVIEPMPLTISNGSSPKQSTLTKPKQINWVRFMFNQTIGGTINGVPIALNKFDMTNIGNPPEPARGIFEMSVYSSWDDFENPSYTIEHNDPFNIILLGVFYSVEI